MRTAIWFFMFFIMFHITNITNIEFEWIMGTTIFICMLPIVIIQDILEIIKKSN